jgi:hypothetical protein
VLIWICDSNLKRPQSQDRGGSESATEGENRRSTSPRTSDGVKDSCASYQGMFWPLTSLTPSASYRVVGERGEVGMHVDYGCNRAARASQSKAQIIHQRG